MYSIVLANFSTIAEPTYKFWFRMQQKKNRLQTAVLTKESYTDDGGECCPFSVGYTYVDSLVLTYVLYNCPGSVHLSLVPFIYCSVYGAMSLLKSFSIFVLVPLKISCPFCSALSLLQCPVAFTVPCPFNRVVSTFL